MVRHQYLLICAYYAAANAANAGRCRALILSGYGVPSECSDGIFSGSDMVDNQFFALVVEYVDIHVE